MYGITLLGNGLVHIRDYRSGLCGLYSPAGLRRSGDLILSPLEAMRLIGEHRLAHGGLVYVDA